MPAPWPSRNSISQTTALPNTTAGTRTHQHAAYTSTASPWCGLVPATLLSARLPQKRHRSEGKNLYCRNPSRTPSFPGALEGRQDLQTGGDNSGQGERRTRLARSARCPALLAPAAPSSPPPNQARSTRLQPGFHLRLSDSFLYFKRGFGAQWQAESWPAGTMARAPMWVRFCDIAAVLVSGGDAKAAVPVFENYCPEHGIKESLKAFLDRWWQRYLNRTDGECFLHDSHRTGRPVQLTQEHKERAAKAFAAGFWSYGKKKGFESLEQVRCTWLPAHCPPRQAQPCALRPCAAQPRAAIPPHPPCMQALQKSEKLQKILAETGVKLDYLWRQAKRVDPKLCFKDTTVKPEFTKTEMEQRCNFCMDMLNEPPEWLHGIIWEDESSVPVCPQHTRVIGRHGEEALVTDKRMARDVRQVPWLHYWLAVCWATGLVKFDILSYTRKYDAPVQYYVSHPGCCCCLPCSPLPCLCGAACHSCECSTGT